MTTGIIWDVLLILQIEITRGAIAKASKAMSNPMLLNIHVAMAVVTVVLYGFLFYWGRQILQGRRDLLPKHKIAGGTALFLRTATYVTSYMVVS